ncbi:MAG: hypothetical protein IKN55_08605 [Oscillospiraceae bacterium]|nr:hypothetical protein [Oscillospiraceae bacterium]
MTATEFLTQLDAALFGLSGEERESALEYYREYFADAGENADAAAEALGSPQSVAERIIAEADGTADPGLSAGMSRNGAASGGTTYTDPYTGATYTSASYSEPYAGTSYTEPYTEMPYSAPPKSGPDASHIITLIVVLFVTLPLWITVYSLWLSLIVTLISLITGFAAGGIAGPITGIIQMASGRMGDGLFLLGSGLLCAGLTLLLWKPFWLLCKSSTIGLFHLSKKIIYGLLGRNEA